MSDEADRIARAERARAARAEFLGPCLDLIRAEYIEALADIASCPLTADKRAALEKLALGIKVVDRVSAHLEALIAGGEIARAEANRASDLSKLSAEKRRWLGY